MQKYKSNITSTSGAAIRNVPVTVLNEAGELASLFLDRAGAIAAPNPLVTDSSGNFYFYAVNGRYSLRTTVEGVTITDNDVVLLQDPEEITVAGPIAEAVLRAEAAAQRAEFAVEASGIPDLVGAAQNAVEEAQQAVTQASVLTAHVSQALIDAQQAKVDAAASAALAAASAMSVDPAWRLNPTGVRSLNGGQLAGMRNRILNGKMEIAQTGTNFPALAVGSHTLDGWLRGGSATSGVLTFEQSADIPSTSFTASLKVTVTTTDTSITTGKREHILQRIEGFDIADLRGKTFVLSFWVRSSKTGAHCVAFRNGYPDRSYVSEYVVNAANVWEYKTITVPGGLITSGTWNYTNGVGLIIGWALAAGTTYHAPAGAWQNGDFSATANQVNCLDTVGNVFGITGVQLEPGDTATPFEHRKYSTELALCKRYFQKSYVSARFISGSANITYSYDVPPEVEMRATPSITFEWEGSRYLVSKVNFSNIRANGGTRMDVTSSGAGDCYMLDAVITRSARL